MTKTLTANVAVVGKWYYAGDRVGHEIPEDVAEKIVNPKVWTYETEAERPAGTEPKSTTGAQLVARVAVAGKWYGPGDDVPDDVARRIQNPKVWEGGKVPTFDDKPAEAKADADTPAETPADQADDEDPADTAESEDATARPARRGGRRTGA